MQTNAKPTLVCSVYKHPSLFATPTDTNPKQYIESQGLIPLTCISLFPSGYFFLHIAGCIPCQDVPFACAHCSIHHHTRAAALCLSWPQRQVGRELPSALRCSEMPGRVLEGRVMLVQSPFITGKALGGRSQAGGGKVRIASKVWLVVERKGGLWIVLRSSSPPSLSVMAPQATPEGSGRVRISHAAAGRWIH